VGSVLGFCAVGFALLSSIGDTRRGWRSRHACWPGRSADGHGRLHHAFRIQPFIARWR
jgi:hypothetical protein